AAGTVDCNQGVSMQLGLRLENWHDASLTAEGHTMAVDLQAADPPFGPQPVQNLPHHVLYAAHSECIRKGCVKQNQPAMALLQVPWIVVRLVDHNNVLRNGHFTSLHFEKRRSKALREADCTASQECRNIDYCTAQMDPRNLLGLVGELYEAVLDPYA